MENASRALLMAGGILLVMMVIGLVIFAWGKFSEFYSYTDDLSSITDLAKFNEQFTNYDRDDVLGYELVSLANQVADYNNKHSFAEGSNNNEGYTPITLVIDFVNQDSINRHLRYDTDLDNANKLFSEVPPVYTQSEIKNEIESKITSVLGIEKVYGNTDTASKLAKNINALTKQYYINQGYTEDAAKELVIKEYNSIMHTNETSYDAIKNDIFGRANVYKYYEFYQFKKAYFKCTGIEYDSGSNRVSKITFTFDGKVQ